VATRSQTPVAAEEAVAFAGAAKQAEMVRAGEVSPKELVELSLRRIERVIGHLRRPTAPRAAA